MQAGLLLDSQDLKSERAASPEVASWVLALWTERLVGGEAGRADDPPAIALLVRLSPRAGYRVCRMAGLCKLILAGHRRIAMVPPATELAMNGSPAGLRKPIRSAELARRDVETGRSSRPAAARSQPRSACRPLPVLVTPSHFA